MHNFAVMLKQDHVVNVETNTEVIFTFLMLL